MSAEIGGVICCKGVKCTIPKLYSQGQHSNVTVPIGCPPGYKAAGVWHTHPDGVAYPSNKDIASLRKARIPISCITNNITTKCYKI